MSSNPDGVHRHANRFRAGVRVDLDSGAGTIECEAENISKTGVLLVGPLVLQTSETIEFTIYAPTGSLKVHLMGRVIRVVSDDEGGVRAAVEFSEMDELRRAGLEALLSRLLQGSSSALGPFDHLKPGSPPLEIKKALDAIPLPQRIALAARAGPKEREILRLDTQPPVLEALVRNSSLTLLEARALAASTHLMQGTLDALANDPRFKDDEDLRMTVATHARVSVFTAEKITQGFKAPQLKKLLARPGLNQLLREKLIRRSNER